MKALLVVPRLPGTGFTGDRVRVEMHIEALKLAGFEIVLVGGAPSGEGIGALEGVSSVRPVPFSHAGFPFALAAAAFRGDPLQSALQAGPWARALAGAGDRFDLVVWSLVRIWPHVRGRLPGAPVVLDFIDALAAGADQAAERDPAGWRRLYWRVESPRLARAQKQAAFNASALLSTTQRDASLLPAGTEALLHGVKLGPRPDASPREPVVAFSGRLGYRPNQLAARTLIEDLWPSVRRAVPEARLVLGGADAPRELGRLDGKGGVSVVSPVAEMPAFLRRARVVAVPLELGTGLPNKLLEAFEAGAAVVASEDSVSRASLASARAPALAARTRQEFVDGLISYLRDPSKAAADGAAGRDFVERHGDRRRAVERLASVFRDAAEGVVPRPRPLAASESIH
ncbi:MAG TPA: glycosyltransferase family 4 protein [Thermoanaerobaculia bacterium]|nr:glycosyltransferase family 4 protein [Thermoanaerobaculia bacterium]